MPFIDGGDSRVGNGLVHLVGEGSGAAFHLGGFEQVSAGFVENHAPEAIGHHHRHLAAVDVVGIKHRGGTGADLCCGCVDIPFAQIERTIGGAITASDAGAMLAISGENAEPAGLVQPDVACKRAITGGDEHLLPVAAVAATAHLQVSPVLLQQLGSMQQLGGADGEIRRLG